MTDMPRPANEFALPEAEGAGARDRLCPHGNLPARPVTNPAQARRGILAMANILVNIEKGIEIAAEDALKWLSGANKALQATPKVIAALATLAGAVEKPLSELAGAAANPLNIPLDIETVNDLRAVWPDVKTFLGSLGVKF
jgi:hypothetical protein